MFNVGNERKNEKKRKKQHFVRRPFGKYIVWNTTLDVIVYLSNYKKCMCAFSIHFINTLYSIRIKYSNTHRRTVDREINNVDLSLVRLFSLFRARDRHTHTHTEHKTVHFTSEKNSCSQSTINWRWVSHEDPSTGTNRKMKKKRRRKKCLFPSSI